MRTLPPACSARAPHWQPALSLGLATLSDVTAHARVSFPRPNRVVSEPKTRRFFVRVLSFPDPRRVS
eukprot:577608-Rhodomonas_salina.2